MRSNFTSEDTIKALQEVFCRTGFPRKIVTDNGPQFVSLSFRQFLKENNIEHVTSPCYHPASNGLAERFIQTLKGSLGETSNSDINTKLQKFLLSYRNSIHSSSGNSPAKLLFGRNIRDWLDNLGPRPSRNQESTICRQFHPHDIVLVRQYVNKHPKWKVGRMFGLLGIKCMQSM
ncbi:Gag-Pro-Pol polyprotein [Thelohanellus kitauei]|uniref:Gag-Pro-Pol polyprotein n=1 Tax=Thelohanellus kitauei TaxID=669202 RepID=A0A0C2MF19_THEKT|nr:Gag-Pro-Pol polyprotein [Thelohanellus kitauei]